MSSTSSATVQRSAPVPPQTDTSTFPNSIQQTARNESEQRDFRSIFFRQQKLFTMKRFTQTTLVLATLLIAGTSFAQTGYFFPKATSFDAAVPTPEKFLGYPIGTHYTRHEQIVDYFRELAKVSNRIHVQSIGKTYEEREQIIATVTSPENFARLEEIRQQHLTLVDPAKPLPDAKAPVIIHLGYNVHGNESSSAEVSLLTAYYLAASKDAETESWLKDAVIFIDPSLNPDGRDRAANWFNSYASWPAVGDPQDKEHNEVWPGGRVNHYFADLNRDWLNLVHVESRNRVKFFHQWYPNVQIDFHEQGANATYYFEPTPKRHESPVIPQFLYDENAVLATYHAKALDEIGSLYFTKENYDNLSPIYGSTYPKFFGSVAATFEQAGSRGIVTETGNGPLTFAFSIRNHLTTSFSTIRGAIAEKANLFNVQKNLFKYALDQGKASAVKAYVFGDSRDVNLTQKFLSLLLQHHVAVYDLPASTTLNGKSFDKGFAYVVPSAQPNYLLVHSLFEENSLKDSIYYDNTGWSVIHAYGLQYAKLAAPDVARGNQVTQIKARKGEVRSGQSSLAYVTSYTDYNASKALSALLDKGVVVKTAFKPFTAIAGGEKAKFGLGSLVIPVAGQTLSSDSLYRLLQQTAQGANVSFTAVGNGLSAEGIDLGSSNIKAVKKPAIAVAFGQGVTASEAGQVWQLVSQQLNLPVTKLDVQNFDRFSLRRYTTLVLPGGNYSAWTKSVADKIKAWVAEGGTLITFQAASAWAVQNELVKEKLVGEAVTGSRTTLAQGATTEGSTTTRPAASAFGQTANEGASDKADGPSLAKAKTERLDYATQQDVEGAKRINGAIFSTDLDITNPLAFGVTSRKLFVNKNTSTFLQPSANKYATVAQYTADPFVNGYTSKANVKKVSGSAAIILSPNGAGQVVLFADDPTYRGYWLGTARIFLNAIFFANLATLTSGVAGEE